MAKLVTKVVQKDKEGNIDYSKSKDLGVSFDNVYSLIFDVQGNKTYYSLKQFFDHYKTYMESANFVYSGPNQPVNTHVALWIDTTAPQN